MLEFSYVSAGYNNPFVVDSISFSVARGETVLLFGANGSGKSTVLRAAAGLLPHCNGVIKLDGLCIESREPEERARLGLGYLPQVNTIFPSLTAMQNLRVALYPINRLSFQEKLAQALQLFPTLTGRLQRKSGLLSGGERQCLALAMTLLRQNKVVMLDEPTGGLAPKIAKQLLNTLKGWQVETGTSILIVEHRLAALHDWVHRTLVLDKGKIISEEIELSALRQFSL